MYFGFVIKNTVVTDGASALFVCESCISYSKSDTALSPLIKISEPTFFAYSIVRPSKLSTSTLSSPISLTASCIRATLSAVGKKPFLESFFNTAIITLPNILEALARTSKCPFVTGSKLPGYIAVFPIHFFPYM